MKRFAFKFAVSTILPLIHFCVFAQNGAEKFVEKYSCSSRNQNAVLDYFANLEAQQKRITEIERKTRERQIAQFGKVLPLISPQCEWGGGGCPANLVLPRYPVEARRLRLFGQIKVEVIADEKGAVIFARAFGDKQFLLQAARDAACRSSFTPLNYDNEAVKFERTIVYNFTAND